MADKIELGFFKIRMILKLTITTHPFIISEYPNAIFEVMDLKQTGTVQSYYEELEGFCNLLQLTEEDALQIFINNLNSKISKSVRSFYPKTIEDALKLAQFYELPKNHDSPYGDPNITHTIQTTIFPPLNQFLLPSLLPKPKMATHANLFPLSPSSTLFNPLSDFVLITKSDPVNDFAASFSDEDNKLHKECDVVSILGDPEASRFCYLTFHQLQYHGQGAGIIVIDSNVFQLISRYFINEYWFECLDDACEKLEVVYSMVFEDKFVDVNDPYGFKLLVMERIIASIDVLSISDVFECSVLISFWRVRHAWHKNLLKRCSETEMSVEISRRLGLAVDGICRRCGNVDMFEKFMEDFVDCLDFMDYFKAIWYPRIGPWISTLVPLPFASLETCVAMEFYHNQLKHRLLNEKAYVGIASNLGSESVDRIVIINGLCGETVGEGISSS